jgi:hypothetical protein
MQVLLEHIVNKEAARRKAQRKYERFYASVVNIEQEHFLKQFHTLR